LQSKLEGNGANAVIDGIQELLDQSNLLTLLTQQQRDKLTEAVASLRGAVAALPTTIADALSFTLPGRLLSAVTPLQDAIAAIAANPPSGPAFDQLKGFVREIKDSLPSLQTVVPFLLDALGLDDLVRAKLTDLQGVVLQKVNDALAALQALATPPTQII